jgi:hypothetical protein
MNDDTIEQLRLVVKNIPENLSDNQINDLFNKNFEGKFKDLNICCSVHKYSKNSKFCFLTVDSFDVRKKVMDFFSTFEIIDPKGIKIKLIVLDCLYQNRIKENKDNMINSIGDSIFFLI